MSQSPEPEQQTIPTSSIDNCDQGRIGYGRFARYSPLALAIVLGLTLLAIGLYQRWPEDAAEPTSELVGMTAPVFQLTTLDGEVINSDVLSGQTVVLNFWGSWCAPCLVEMPEFQSVSDEALAGVVIVGVGIKMDNDENARALVDDLALSYVIGRDTGGSNRQKGPIQLEYRITNFPSTVFISPDGTVAAVRIGEMTSDEIRASIRDAQQ